MHQNESAGVTSERSSEHPVCPACGGAMSQGAKLCLACESNPGAETGEAVVTRGRQRRQITLLFCDMVDSTGLAEQLDPEDLADVISRFQRITRVAMREFGGFVARQLGDETLAYFGYPEAHEDDAERAVKAALRALEGLATLFVGEQRVHAHIGIATGLVIVGDLVGTGGPPNVDVAGATPNLAARLRNLAAPDSILVADTTRRLVGEMVEWQDLGVLTLRGMARPVRAWQVLALRVTDSRFDVMHGGTLAPLLGRDPELARIEEAWDAACHGKGQVMLIRGEPGIGKSRLAAQMFDRLRLRPHARLRYFSSSHRRGSPLHPCVQQLEHAANFSRSDGPAERLAKLESCLPAIPERDLQLIAELLLIPTAGRFPVLQLGPQRRRELLMDALLNVVEVFSKAAPLLMLFEDTHWSDESSLALLDRLVARCEQLPVLLLVTTRPKPSLPWAQRAHVTELSLAPLESAQRIELAKWVAGGRPLPSQTIRDIDRRSDGIPLYVEELTQAVIEDAEEKSSSGTVPKSLQDSLQARLDRLGESAKDIVQAAACIGREFLSELLALVVNRPIAELRQTLSQLVEASILVPRTVPDQDGESYVFRHALLRDVAYETMVGDQRRSRHARIAEVLEAHFAQRVGSQPDLMAQHCTEAGLLEKAVHYWYLAGIQAMRRSAMTEALVFLRRGLKTSSELPSGPSTGKRELELTIALGQAQIATQGYATAETRETFERARVLCQQMNGPPQLLSVLHGLWTNALMTADMEGARLQALDLLEQGKRNDDSLWLLMGHRFCGVTHHPMGSFAKAVSFLRRGIELYDPAHRATYAPVTPDDPEIVMLTYLSWSLMCLGQLDEARACSALALEKARSLHQAYSLAHALIGASFVALTIESPRAGLRRLDEALPLMQEHGIAYYDAVGQLFRGWCLAALQEKSEARLVLAQGMKAYRATGSRLYLAGFLRMTAEAQMQIGDAEGADVSIEESFAVMQATHQQWDEAEIHRVRGQLFLARGRVADASTEFRRGSEIAALQGAGLWRLRSAYDLALLTAEQGNRDQARLVLEPACQALQGQSDLPDMARARKLLASLC
jgi:class 3 adenylate cyclase/predicted ATPase